MIQVKNTFFILVFIYISMSFSQIEKAVSRDLLVVKFHADWCASCIEMGPTFENVQTRFVNNNSINFIKLDFTNKETTERATKIGDELGITSILVQNNRKTGFALIIDKQTKEVLFKLTKNDNVDVMEQKIKDIYEGLSS